MEPLIVFLFFSAMTLLFVSLYQIKRAHYAEESTVEDFVKLIYSNDIRAEIIDAFTQMIYNPGAWSGYIIKTNGNFSVWAGNDWWHRKLYYGDTNDDRNLVYKNFNIQEKLLLDEGVKVIKFNENLTKQRLKRIVESLCLKD